MSKTCYYQQRRTYLRYDATHIIGYLDETVVENYTPETPMGHGEGDQQPEPWPTAYGYTGTETDGGTIMECPENETYGDLANAIIRSRYSQSQELAIHRHAAKGDYDQNTQEFDDYNAWCENAVTIAKRWAGIESE